MSRKQAICGDCRIPLCEDNSYKRKSGPDSGRFVGVCRSCNKSRLRKWRKANPTKALARGMKHRYGVDLSEYLAVRESQNNRCAICGIELKSPHIDHDHKRHPVVIRGLLCHLCNKGLGCFHDSEEILLAAVKYLAKSKL